MSDPMHILPCYYLFAAAAASDAPGPWPLYCVVHRPPRRRSWQTLPPPGASAVAPGQYNYAPIHEQALAIQEMGYEAYERLNKQVGGRGCGVSFGCRPSAAACVCGARGVVGKQAQLRPPGNLISPAHPTPSGVTHPPRQADNETCTYGCGAAVWAGLAFGSELTRYLCSINATVEPQTCSDPYLNQVCHVTHGTVAAASNPTMFSKATL